MNPQGGDKFFTITLSNPMAGGSNSVTTIGQATTSVTIVDVHISGTATNIVGYSDSNAYVEASGPTANSTFLDILGSSSSSAAYGLLDFNDQDGSGFQFNPGGNVTAINSVTLGLVNSPFSSSANGILDVYLVSDATTALNSSSLTYDTSDPPEWPGW